MRTVLTGVTSSGIEWHVTAGIHADGDFATFVFRKFGARNASAGMLGPKLWPGQVVNSLFCVADGISPFVVVRSAPEVARVTVVGTLGMNYELPLAPLDAEFNMRFGAVVLLDDDELGTLNVELEDGTMVTNVR